MGETDLNFDFAIFATRKSERSHQPTTFRGAATTMHVTPFSTAH